MTNKRVKRGRATRSKARSKRWKQAAVRTAPPTPGGAAERPERNWDRLGVWASGLCAVHCLAAPLLFLAVPALGELWAHPASHVLIALVVLPLAGQVLVKGFRRHRRAWVAATAGAGATCILVGSCLPFLAAPPPALAAHDHDHDRRHDRGHDHGHVHDAQGQACCVQLVTDESGKTRVQWPAATVVTLIGSGLLVAGHLGNLASLRCCGGPPRRA